MFCGHSSQAGGLAAELQAMTKMLYLSCVRNIPMCCCLVVTAQTIHFHAQSCVKKPLCVPKDLTLTIEEQICMAPIGTQCWLRSYGCGNYYQDLAPAADQMYQYYRGFWDFSWSQYYSKMW